MGPILGKITGVTAGLRIEFTSEKLKPRGWLVVGVFRIAVLLGMSDFWHGLPPAIMALLPAIVLTATRVFTREDLNRIEWKVLILIAGGIALGTGMQLAELDRVVMQGLPTDRQAIMGLWHIRP